MVTQPIPVEVFCSFAHEDEVWLRKLETHLRLLQRQKLISFWHDRLLAPGMNWATAIDTHLETASVILLLVSADFFASDYCFGVEMKRALARQEMGEARVIPILIRPTDWQSAPFAHLQTLPTDSRPIVSWQDQDEAFADVATGIRRVIVEELSQLAASAPHATLPAIWNIPYPRNPFFLGRDGELLQVRQNLQTGQATALAQPQAINGLGGIGKTQLALEYAYRHRQDYQVVLWVRAESIETLISSYITLASLLRLPEGEAKEQDIAVQAVKSWLQNHRGWLLILDNADDLTLLPDFLPASPGGHILLTTRAGATGRLARRLEIKTLLPEQGALFLLRRAALLSPDDELAQAPPQERGLALQISQEMGGLPLALDQAGAYLEETGVDLAGYWLIYQQHRTDLLQKRGGLVVDHPAPVATTWSLSFWRVEEQNPTAADLLRVCAFLSPDTIPEELLTVGASLLGPRLASIVGDAFSLNQAIEALRTYSLIQRDPKEKTFAVHRLVQVVLQNTLEDTERHLWAERAMLAINAAFPANAVFPKSEHSIWPQCERLLSQALAATRIIEKNRLMSEEVGRLLHRTAAYLLERARYAEAEPLFQRTLHIREQQLGPQHPEVASSLHELARLYREQGKYAEAEPLFQRTLHIREQQLGSQHPEVASSLYELARLYREQGKYAEAESLYQRALRICEQQLGPQHPQVPPSLIGLARLYFEQGKHAEAESLYLRALSIWEHQLGPQHPWMAYPLTGLADLFLEQGKYAEAKPLYQRALRIHEQQLRSQHPQVAHPLNSLARLYFEQGKYNEAEPLYQQALHINEQQFGPQHSWVAYPLHGLANLYFEQGKYTKAEQFYQRALHIREQVWGFQHPETAETAHDLGQFHEVQGNREEAITWYALALEVREQALGAHHPKTAQTRKRFIALLHAMGQHEKAALFEAVQFEFDSCEKDHLDISHIPQF